MIAVSNMVNSNVQDYNLDIYHWIHMYPSENVYLKIALLLFSCDILSNSLGIIWIATHHSPLSSVSWSLLKLISVELVMLSNHLMLCYPLLLPSNFPSIRVFSNELSIRIRWPKYWSFSFSSRHSNESVSASVQSLSHFRLFVTPWTAVHQASLSITNSRTLPKLMFIESVMPSNHPLSSPSPPAFNPSQHQCLFKWVSSSHQVAKILEFQLQHPSFQWTPGKDFL